MQKSPVSSSVDFDRPGVQHGHLRLPYSRDDSAWGSIAIPVAVIANGRGPTVLLTGANHGDEYEGPAALMDLALNLRAEDLCGRVIIVPMMNFPAFVAGRRTSPIDAGNMNRVFPGSPTGGVTEKIADYFERTLLPRADFVLDIHSGGKTLEFVPFAAAHVLEDKAQQDRCVAAMAAFNAPFSMMLMELDAVGMYDTAAEAQGKVFVSTELGGGGTATAETVAIARRGVRNLLIHAGVLSGTVERGESTLLDTPDDRCYVISESSGLVEPCVALGDRVREGDVLLRVHDVHHTGREPEVYRAGIDGILAGRHFPGLIRHGDCMALVAVPA